LIRGFSARTLEKNKRIAKADVTGFEKGEKAS